VLGTATAATSHALAERRQGRPLLVEFMLVGGATLVLFPLSWLLRNRIGLDAATFAAGFATFYAAYVINDPHFCVTYLLFYKDVRRRALCDGDRAQRARYWLAGFVGPFVLVAWAALALGARSAAALGWMIQLMFLLVGWHYVKQGYGVLSVLAARRGTPLLARERRALLLHCFAAWAYAWANPAVPPGAFEEKGVVYLAVGKPHWLELTAGAALLASIVVLAWALFTSLRHERRRLPVLPLAAFLITVWSWTIYSSVDPVVQYAIPALHSIQYLYFVALMKRNQAQAEQADAFGPSASTRLGIFAMSALALAWLLLRGAPTFLDDVVAAHAAGFSPDGPLGPTPFFAAFFVVINIHHYLMDNVIWRRENPDTRFLRG
jgi:hypothetical protein